MREGWIKVVSYKEQGKNGVNYAKYENKEARKRVKRKKIGRKRE